MLGIEFEGLLRFSTQLFAALAGATSFWGFVLLYKHSKASADSKSGFKKAAIILTPIFFAALAGFMVLWWYGALFVFAAESIAHEGVVHTPVSQDIVNGFDFNLPWVSLAGILGALGAFLYFFRRKVFEEHVKPFFAIQFILISIIVSFSLYSPGDIREQLVHITHNWHSIFTLATVITVDLLFLFSLKDDDVKRSLYRFFPIMSAAIWMGLGLDFVSSYLSWGSRESLEMTSQLYFNQTVVVILIINGALLSGKINSALINLIKPDKVLEFTGKMKTIVGVSGAVSIVSWFTITFIDFFDIPLAFWQFMAAYLAIIAVVAITHPISEKFILKLLPDSR